MQFKTTTRLFRGAYQYKIVLICAGSGTFRSGDMAKALADLNKINIKTYNHPYRHSIKTQDDLDYAISLATVLDNCEDVNVRVESPWISVYSNSETDIENIANISIEHVKYISKPPANQELEVGTIILPKMNYDYRVTLGKTNKEHTTFIEWADKSDKLKLTNSCRKDLSKDLSWGGTHFYVTGEKNLLMVKMHLGGSISKVERIIKA